MAGHKFRRQHLVVPFVVDFVCISAKLVVEIDGGQRSNQTTADERRTVHLNEQGYKVIRFWNNEVLENTESVLETILQHLKGASPSPSSG